MKYSKLSLCLVVANSDDCLLRFFKWSLARFQEIIIVKSDSEDSTNSILQDYSFSYPNQIKVHYRPIDNIANQKQYCLDLSKKDWRLIVDADEIFEDIDFDKLKTSLEEKDVDLVYFPRYNLQLDQEHYLSEGYPDHQPRLMRSNVSFSKDPIHETHHKMVGYKNAGSLNSHIIHWGHIRSEEQNLWKSRMRLKYADMDLCDGDGLKNNDNWFHERNKLLNLDQKLVDLPENVKKYIRKTDKRDLGVFSKYLNSLKRTSVPFMKVLIQETELIDGWLMGNQIPLMWSIFSTFEGRAVEVGCWKGRATHAFKSFIPKDQFELFCVDPFLGSSEHKDSLNGASTRKDFEDNLREKGILSSIFIIEKYSVDAARDFEDGSLDLVFIDAEHDYDNVKLDILSWSPKLKSGGIILGHDYPNPNTEDGGFEELCKAVNEEVRDSANFYEFSYLFGIWGAKKI